MKFDEEQKKYERPEKTKQELTVPLLKLKHESERKAELRKLQTVSSSIEGMNDILGGGYVRGTLLNVVGFPKAGKTTITEHEVLNAALQKKESFVMFNESPWERYEETVWTHAMDLLIPDEATDYITFANAHEKDLKSASYDYIDKMAVIWIRRPLEEYLKAGHRPQFVVFDSITKFCRTYAAQVFRFIQAVVFNIHDLWKQYDVHPVTFLVHQKSSGEYGRDDSNVFGGWGGVHEVDGSIVLRYVDVDTWFQRDTGFPIGTRQRFIRADSRFVRIPELEYYFYYVKDDDGHNRLKVGRPLVEIAQEWKQRQLKEQAKD